MVTPVTSAAIGRWAEVRAAEHVTRYFRRGAGLPVVVLGALEDADHVWPDLIEALPQHCRVFLPQSPAKGRDFASWLLAFVDGLGLPKVAVVAGGPFCVAALDLATLAPDQLGSFVLIPATEAEASGLTAELNAAAPIAAPVLIIARGQPAPEAMARISRFVTGETA